MITEIPPVWSSIPQYFCQNVFVLLTTTFLTTLIVLKMDIQCLSNEEELFLNYCVILMNFKFPSINNAIHNWQYYQGVSMTNNEIGKAFSTHTAIVIYTTFLWDSQAKMPSENLEKDGKIVFKKHDVRVTCFNLSQNEVRLFL
jgi:hypothetical protein